MQRSTTLARILPLSTEPQTVGERLSRTLGDLVVNVRGGMHLAFLRRVAPQHFRASADQVVLLLLLSLATGLAWEWLLTEPPRVFDSHGLMVIWSWVLVTMGLGYLANREGRRGLALERLLVMMFSPLFTAWIGFALLELAVVHWNAFADFVARTDLYWPYLFAIWLAPVYAHVIHAATGMPRLRATALATAYAVLVFIGFVEWPSAYLLYTDYSQTAEAREPRPPRLDAEGVLHVQRSRVEELVAALAPQRPGVVDLYFVGFGASARQGVFRREIEFVRALFDRRFDTEGRSIALINHRDLVESDPIASVSNLRDALHGVAARMDPNEDVLFLYLTGHGSKQHEVHVRFPGLPLNHVGAETLADAIEEAGVGWRVVGVSACYSGGFVEPLRDDRALVITASAADRTSFGCRDDAEMTDFADAYFRQSLEHTVDFVRAFEEARRIVALREAELDRKSSMPQIAIGEGMAAHLERLSARLADANALDESDAPELRAAQASAAF